MILVLFTPLFNAFILWMSQNDIRDFLKRNLKTRYYHIEIDLAKVLFLYFIKKELNTRPYMEKKC